MLRIAGDGSNSDLEDFLPASSLSGAGISFRPGQTVRVKFWARVAGGITGVRVQGAVGSVVKGTAATDITASGSWVEYTATITATSGLSAIDMVRFALLPTSGVQTSADYIEIDDVQMLPDGALCDLALDDGIGFQLHDRSTNKLDAVMTTTGVAHVIARRTHLVRGRLTWAGTHEAKSLIGQVISLDGFRIEAITLKASAATTGSGATVGNTNSATRYVAATALTTAKKVFTGSGLANAVPGGTTSTYLDIVVDPDTNNYTGSIDVTVEYVQTEGASA